MKIMKQRAAQNFKNATKANGAETRWEKFVAAGPPPPPVPDQNIYVNLRGADSARRVVQMIDVSVNDLFLPFSDEVHFGERVGLIGPNGTGKSHLLGALAGTIDHFDGTIGFGPRTSIGTFTQINDRPDFRGRECFEIVRDRVFEDEKSMKALARYGLAANARQEFSTLSGGQKARMEILCLELEGHNVLLLDEPTDNLDIESSEALEKAGGQSRPHVPGQARSFRDDQRRRRRLLAARLRAGHGGAQRPRRRGHVAPRQVPHLTGQVRRCPEPPTP